MLWHATVRWRSTSRNEHSRREPFPWNLFAMSIDKNIKILPIESLSVPVLTLLKPGIFIGESVRYFATCSADCRWKRLPAIEWKSESEIQQRQRRHRRYQRRAFCKRDSRCVPSARFPPTLTTEAIKAPPRSRELARSHRTRPALFHHWVVQSTSGANFCPLVSFCSHFPKYTRGNARYNSLRS